MGIVVPGVWAQEAVEAAESAAASEISVTQVKGQALSKLSEILQVDLGDNSLGNFGICFLLLLLTLVIRKIVVYFLIGWMKRLAAKTKWETDDKIIEAMGAPIGWMTVVTGFYIAVNTLVFPAAVDSFLLNLYKASSLTIVFWGILRVVDVAAEAMAKKTREREMMIHHFIPLIKKAVRVFILVIAALLVIQNLGYSVGALLGGLGIGGLAIALAAQESLGNFFGSVSVVADRPFKIGDWIQVGSKVDGDVEEIGLRSTKVRTWSKSQLTIPNKVLANEIIENWSRMPKRRVKQYVGVTYSTSPDAMEALVEDIRQLLREDEGVQQDFMLVNFTDFGDSALQILVYYFTKTTAWLEHMDIRQRINLKIMRAVEARGSSIAFPTRTLHLDGEIAKRLVDKD